MPACYPQKMQQTATSTRHICAPFCCYTTAGNGWSTTKGLEAGLCDIALLIHLHKVKSEPCHAQSMPCSVGKINVSQNPQTYPDLQLHNVSTRRCPYQASTHTIIQLGKGPHVSWLLVMVNHLHAQCTASWTIPKDFAHQPSAGGIAR